MNYSKTDIGAVKRKVAETLGLEEDVIFSETDPIRRFDIFKDKFELDLKDSKILKVYPGLGIDLYVDLLDVERDYDYTYNSLEAEFVWDFGEHIGWYFNSLENRWSDDFIEFELEDYFNLFNMFNDFDVKDLPVHYLIPRLTDEVEDSIHDLIEYINDNSKFDLLLKYFDPEYGKNMVKLINYLSDKDYRLFTDVVGTRSILVSIDKNEILNIVNNDFKPYDGIDNKSKDYNFDSETVIKVLKFFKDIHKDNKVLFNKD